MIELSAIPDVVTARRMLGKAVGQLPFATASALTATVKLAQVAEERALPSVFDKPTPFTLRGIGVKTATKGNPTAAVYVRPQQAAGGLLLQETGGTRTPAKRALVRPVGAKLNTYGNLPRRGVKSLLARPNVFSGTVGGIGGIWQRPPRPKGQSRRGAKVAPKLLVAFEDRAQYRARFGFKVLATRVIKAALTPAFREAVRKALATAR